MLTNITNKLIILDFPPFSNIALVKSGQKEKPQIFYFCGISAIDSIILFEPSLVHTCDRHINTTVPKIAPTKVFFFILISSFSIIHVVKNDKKEGRFLVFLTKYFSNCNGGTY
jgi:hypothetical protein